MSTNTTTSKTNTNGNVKIKGISTTLSIIIIQTIKELSNYSHFIYNDSKEEDLLVWTKTANESSSQTNKIKDIIQKLFITLRTQSSKTLICALNFLLSVAIPSLKLISKKPMKNNPSKSKSKSKSISISIQRASLYLSYHLLCCSKDCRESFASHHPNESVNLLVLVQTLKKHKDINNRMVHDIVQMLHSLSTSKLFGHLYPRFHVAYRYLSENSQHQINVFHGTKTIQSNRNNQAQNENNENNDYHINTHSFLSIGQLRDARDQALKYGKMEIKHIQQWIDKANVCFEILVPRMGYNVHEYKDSTTTSKQIPIHTDSDVDDVDIDWEDGDNEQNNDNDDENCSTICNDNPFYSTNKESNSIHREKVEQTLKVMLGAGTDEKQKEKYAAGVDYSIEIDFESKNNDPSKTMKNDSIWNGGEFSFADIPPSTNNHYPTNHYYDPSVSSSVSPSPSSTLLDKVATSSAKETLELCISQISHTYLPRLRLWIDALISSDDLVRRTNQDSSSLARMSLPQRQMRKIILEDLMDIKTKAVSVLSSASLLDILRPSSMQNDNEDNDNDNDKKDEMSWRQLLESKTKSKYRYKDERDQVNTNMNSLKYKGNGSIKHQQKKFNVPRKKFKIKKYQLKNISK